MYIYNNYVVSQFYVYNYLFIYLFYFYDLQQTAADRPALNARAGWKKEKKE